MDSKPVIDELLSSLNEPQRQAAVHGRDPLLIVAGAGTGKTTTLSHRVAHLIATGVNPARILLLTFTRRAANEMICRVDGILRRLNQINEKSGISSGQFSGRRLWGGTFHAVAARLLRMHGRSIGLEPEFTVHDRSDSEDLINVLRGELDLASAETRFPRKSTCVDIYSRCVNSRRSLKDILTTAFPWCVEYEDDLRRLFAAYVDRKEQNAVLDYDDLLLFWQGMLSDPAAGTAIRSRFDCVLVDEYQDTNVLQAEILHLLRPDGQGVTVVGDDAQSIYSFRAATVRNILDFPETYEKTRVIALEQNYRSTQPILDVTNDVIAQAQQRHDKSLWSEQEQGDRPVLVYCDDDNEQTEFVVSEILGHREKGVDLRWQAVLFRASQHSMNLELELARRNIRFHKYGGLKFVETAHVKDMMAFLRLAENPRDYVSGTRVLLLLPGIGPKRVRDLMRLLNDAGGEFQIWQEFDPPSGAKEYWPALIELMRDLSGPKLQELSQQVHRVHTYYADLLERKYDHADARLRDLEQLEHLANRFPDRATFLTEITLDPPASTQDLAGPPTLDDDYLVLSTIHSAKGLEWDAVYVLNAADGKIPSDMSTKNEAEIEEELRLFYVALTRAKNSLYVCFPMNDFHSARRYGGHTLSQLTRFLPKKIRQKFEERTAMSIEPDEAETPPHSHITSEMIRKQSRSMWS